MSDNGYIQAIGGVMVTLLVLAWLFPGVTWLEPFRAKRLPRRLRTRAADADLLPTFTPGRVSNPLPMTAVEARIEASQQTFRRGSSLHAGASLIGAGVVLLLGGTSLASLTGLGDTGSAVVTTFAALLVGAGALAALPALRNR
jgi:hypothetical protein